MSLNSSESLTEIHNKGQADAKKDTPLVEILLNFGRSEYDPPNSDFFGQRSDSSVWNTPEENAVRVEQNDAYDAGFKNARQQ